MSAGERLRVAAHVGNLEEVRKLLDEGVNVNAMDGIYKHTPLHVACINGHTKVAEFLIQRGANVNATNKDGYVPLHDVSSNGHFDVAKLLLDKGANVNATNRYGNVPLHNAIKYGNEDIAWLLLDRGADYNAVGNEGKTPAMVAKKYNSSASLLEELGKKTSGSASTGETKDPLSRPSMWSITYKQLMDINEKASKFEGYQTMTMRDVNRLIVEPVCKEAGTSYALHLNPNGLMVDAFVTHCWDEPFETFVESIRKAFLASINKPNLWICAFALVQGDEKKVTEQLGGKDEPLTDAPFVKALRQASKFVVVRNSVTDLYSRIWCVCELIYAKKFGFIYEKTFVTGPNKFSDLSTSVREAESTNPNDGKDSKRARARK